MPMPTKIWKTHPAYTTLLDLLQKKGAMADSELLSALTEEFEDLGFKDFNEILMRLEVSGKIRVTSMSRGKKRVELIG
jgi:DNA topoisomerase VI subunit B